MTQAKAKRLVIDASVAEQAGGAGGPKPASAACRDFLEVVLRLRHGMVWTSEIAEEWQNHAAAYARGWRRKMMGRGLVSFVAATPMPGLEKRLFACINAQKDKTAAQSERRELQKDLHLIYAAWATDCLVASLDEKTRTILRKTKSSVSEVKQIAWVNPDKDADFVTGWLEQGCPNSGKAKL